MTITILLLAVLVAPAAANPTAMNATLEALRRQAASDPASLSTGERASARAAEEFDLTDGAAAAVPVETAAFAGKRANPAPLTAESKPSEDAPGADTDYYFEGKQPLNGITIYTPVKGDGSTSDGESPTDKFGKYGGYAWKAGAAIGAAALGMYFTGAAVSGGTLLAMGLVAGLLIGAGALLSFLFGKKKK